MSHLQYVLYKEWSRYTVHTQVEAKRILYRVIAVIHTRWINQAGRYDITLTHFPLFLLSSVLLSRSLSPISLILSRCLGHNKQILCVGPFSSLISLSSLSRLLSLSPDSLSCSWTLSSASSFLSFLSHTYSALCCCFSCLSYLGHVLPILSRFFCL